MLPNQLVHPFISAELIENDGQEVARIVKGRIEKTLLGEVCRNYFQIFCSQ